MTAEQESLQAEKLPTGSCIELIQPQLLTTEYWNGKRIWILPLHRLDHAFLEQDAEPDTAKGPPLQRLVVVYLTARVILKGRRLDLMLEVLSAGRVARVKAGDPKYAGLFRGEPWIANITVEDLTEEFTPPVQSGTSSSQGTAQSSASPELPGHET